MQFTYIVASLVTRISHILASIKCQPNIERKIIEHLMIDNSNKYCC